ncbi:hypothetical protein [Nocardiopsis nanhaiensis]
MSKPRFLVLAPDALSASAEPFLSEAGDAELLSEAVDAGHRPPAARVADLASAGSTVLVRCGRVEGQDPRKDLPPAPPGIVGAVPVAAAEEVSLAAVYAWAGARVFVTEHPERVRRALDMVASVRGERPPAAVRRGLA